MLRAASVVVVVVVMLVVLVVARVASQSPVDTGPSLEAAAIEGGTVLLPCDVSPPTPGDYPILVLVYNGATGMPIYSIDARSGPEKRSEHWSDLGGRAHFRMTPSAASPSGLLLSHVTPADQGLYRCRVDFVASPTRNVGVELRVVDPPRHLVILDDSGRQVDGLIGPYPVGETLSLTCQVTAGSPRPKVTWWHEGSPLDDVVDEVRGQVTHNQLTLPNLTRQHLHRVLTCRASNSNLTAPLAASVTLDMTFPPLEVRLVGNNTAVREGGLYPLVCEATGSRPPANLTWWINGVLTSTASTSMQVLQKGNVSRSTLQLSPSRRQDGAVVSCRAENPRVQAASALEDSRKLLVYYSPRMRLRPGRNMDMNKIREGDDVYFDCHIEANPRVLNVMWHLDGSELEQNVPRGVIQSNQSLVLQSVSRASTGTYSCSASNLQGSATSNTLRLNVKFAPVCSLGQKWVYGGSRQQPVNVSCQVEAYPEARSFRWAFNTSTDYVEIPPELIHGSSGGSVVSYTPQTHHDFGSLLCWGRNEVNAQRQPCVFHVVPAGVPEPVNNCSAWHNVSASGQVMVGCQAGWGGGLSQTFTLEVRQGTSASPQGSGDPAIRPPGTVLAALRDQLEPHFTVTGLTPGKEYFLAVIASNSQGSAPPTILVHLTPIDVAEKRTSAVVAEASSGDELEKVMPVMGAVVGVIVGVVLCGVALVVGVRLRAAHGRTHALTRIVYGDQAVGAARAPDDGGFMQQKEQKEPDIILVKGGSVGGGGEEVVVARDGVGEERAGTLQHSPGPRLRCGTSASLEECSTFPQLACVRSNGLPSSGGSQPHPDEPQAPSEGPSFLPMSPPPSTNSLSTHELESCTLQPNVSLGSSVGSPGHCQGRSDWHPHVPGSARTLQVTCGSRGTHESTV